MGSGMETTGMNLFILIHRRWMTELWRFNSIIDLWESVELLLLLRHPAPDSRTWYLFFWRVVVASAERSIQKCFVYKWKVSFVHLPFLPSISLYCDIMIIRRLIRLHRWALSRWTGPPIIFSCGLCVVSETLLARTMLIVAWIWINQARFKEIAWSTWTRVDWQTSLEN